MVGVQNGEGNWSGDESREYMSILIDLRDSTYTGTHTASIGGGDRYAFNFAWNDQPLGRRLTAAAVGGDTGIDDDYGLELYFNVYLSGSTVTISPLSSCDRGGDVCWAQTYFATFYR